MEKLMNADAWTIGTICATRAGSEKAARKFRKCIENGGTELHLYHCSLISLPPEIGQLTSLEILWCNNNQLTELPPEIGQFNSLKYFYYGNKQLPDEFNKRNLTIEQKFKLIEKYFRRGRLTKAAR